MRRTANLLFCATGAVWLSTCGFLASGRAFAQEPPRKMAQEAERKAALKRAQEAERKAALDARRKAQEAVLAQQAQQFEQQFGPQLRQLYRTELHFLRMVCQPTKQEYEKIAADGEPALKEISTKLAQNARGLSNEQSDPRTPVTTALAKAVRTTLSPEQAARYQKELEQRAAARRQVVLLNLVAKIDKVLVLTADQRAKLGEVLEKNWNESWNQPQLLMYGAQYMPQMPDAKILPLLTQTQQTVWRGIQKVNVRFGINLGILQGMELEDEVWVLPNR
jgi:hypothetical protein